ncbi:MAG: hypothetical protein R3212_12280, partial [Xanthomonadales bacterium]|nr:hypothetical protein [Xanthomonadales bacterium]
SAADAVEELMAQLADNQLAELEQRDYPFGVAFAHPEGLPGAIYFTRANLVIAIFGQGPKARMVESWGHGIVQGLDAHPDDARPGIRIDPGKAVDSHGVDIVIPPTVPLDADAWLKIEVDGAVPERGKAPGQVIIGPSRGPVTVRVWAFEPGRETLEGRLEYGDR